MNTGLKIKYEISYHVLMSQYLLDTPYSYSLYYVYFMILNASTTL